METLQWVFESIKSGDSEKIKAVEQFIEEKKETEDIFSIFVEALTSGSLNDEQIYLSLMVLSSYNVKLEDPTILFTFLTSESENIMKTAACLIGKNTTEENGLDSVLAECELPPNIAAYALTEVYRITNNTPSDATIHKMIEVLSTECDNETYILAAKLIQKYYSSEDDNEELKAFINAFFQNEVTLENIPLFCYLAEQSDLLDNALAVLISVIDQISHFVPLSIEQSKDVAHFLGYFSNYVFIHSTEEYDAPSLVQACVRLCILSDEQYQHWSENMSDFLCDIDDNETSLRYNALEIILYLNEHKSIALEYIPTIWEESENAQDACYYILQNIVPPQEMEIVQPCDNIFCQANYVVTAMTMNADCGELIEQLISGDDFIQPILVANALILSGEQYYQYLPAAAEKIISFIDSDDSTSFISLVNLVDYLIEQSPTLFGECFDELKSTIFELLQASIGNYDYSSNVIHLLKTLSSVPQFHEDLMATFCEITCQLFSNESTFSVGCLCVVELYGGMNEMNDYSNQIYQTLTEVIPAVETNEDNCPEIINMAAYFVRCGNFDLFVEWLGSLLSSEVNNSCYSNLASLLIPIFSNVDESVLSELASLLFQRCNGSIDPVSEAFLCTFCAMAIDNAERIMQIVTNAGIDPQEMFAKFKMMILKGVVGWFEWKLIFAGLMHFREVEITIDDDTVQLIMPLFSALIGKASDIINAMEERTNPYSKLRFAFYIDDPFVLSNPLNDLTMLEFIRTFFPPEVLDESQKSLLAPYITKFERLEQVEAKEKEEEEEEKENE